MQRTNSYPTKSKLVSLIENVGPQALYVGDLVLKTARHIQKGLSASNFTPKWAGPTVIRENFDSVYFLISQPDSEYLLTPINA